MLCFQILQVIFKHVIIDCYNQLVHSQTARIIWEGPAFFCFIYFNLSTLKIQTRNCKEAMLRLYRNLISHLEKFNPLTAPYIEYGLHITLKADI